MNKKYKVCVYAICKNEEQFVTRWVESMKEADEIVVLDTGSTDNTVEELQKLGIKVETKKISPWRFDVARNESMKLIPEDCDICVCTDLDEVFTPGWREKLEKSWKPTTTRARYKYAWSVNEDGSDGIVFYYEKIHANKLFQWVYPVHEILKPIKPIVDEYVTLDGVKLSHYPDSTKSRGQYLPLLELSFKENPTDDRIAHYLGREYMFYGMHNNCIETLKKHLELPTAVWRDERSASMRFIARSYYSLGDTENAEKYFKLACVESPVLREPWFELGKFYYSEKKYIEAVLSFESMLKITKRELSYITDPVCWGADVYDYLSFCYFKLGNKQQAMNHCNIAIHLNPKEERLKNNLKFYAQM